FGEFKLQPFSIGELGERLGCFLNRVHHGGGSRSSKTGGDGDWRVLPLVEGRGGLVLLPIGGLGVGGWAPPRPTGQQKVSHRAGSGLRSRPLGRAVSALPRGGPPPSAKSAVAGSERVFWPIPQRSRVRRPAAARRRRGDSPSPACSGRARLGSSLRTKPTATSGQLDAAASTAGCRRPTPTRPRSRTVAPSCRAPAAAGAGFAGWW